MAVDEKLGIVHKGKAYTIKDAKMRIKVLLSALNDNPYLTSDENLSPEQKKESRKEAKEFSNLIRYANNITMAECAIKTKYEMLVAMLELKQQALANLECECRIRKHQAIADNKPGIEDKWSAMEESWYAQRMFLKGTIQKIEEL